MFYYIAPDGSYGTSNHKPDNVLLIDQQTYELLRDNPGLLEIVNDGGQLRIVPNVSGYRRALLHKLDVYLAQFKPDFAAIQELHLQLTYSSADCFVYQGKQYGKIELVSLLQEQMDAWVEQSKLHLELSTKAHTASTVEELDGLLERIGG